MGREKKREKKGVINSALRSSAIMVPLFSHLKPTASGSEEIKSRPSHTHHEHAHHVTISPSI